ncbi:MAG: SocA family protein [bacterium]|nr:SocA family protein [bacterium]
MDLKEIMKIVLMKYGGELYNSVLTKIIYLLDLESVKRTGNQISDIHWRKDSHGPFVWNVIHYAEEYTDDFDVIYQEGTNGDKKLIQVKQNRNIPQNASVEELIDAIKNQVPDPKENFLQFVDAVYQTLPMQFAWGRHDEIDIQTAVKAEREVELLASELDTPEWNEAFSYLAAH